MKRKFSTFYQSDDGEILWVTVNYAIDRMHGNQTMYHLSVHHYQSGDITEYIEERWLRKFEEIAWIYYKEEQERLKKYTELSFSDINKVSTNYMIRMVEAGYSNELIIDKLAEICDDIYSNYKKCVEHGVPSIQITFDKDNRRQC